jgi:hypothetical protein
VPSSYRVSAPALRAARLVLENYDLTVKPRDRVSVGYRPELTNHEKHISIVIDYVSNVKDVCEQRTEMAYWHERLRFGTATAPQLAQYLRRLLEAFDHLPKPGRDEIAVVMRNETSLPNFVQGQSPIPVSFQSGKYTLTKPAIKSAQALFQFYDIKATKHHLATVERVAQVIEGGLGLLGACKAQPLAEKCLKGLQARSITLDEVKVFFKDIGLWLNRMPTFEESLEESKILV